GFAGQSRTQQGLPRRSRATPDGGGAQARRRARRARSCRRQKGRERLMFSMNEFGNNLYSGKTSFPFVARRRLWFVIAIALVVGSALMLFVRPPQFSIEFTGGSQFTVTSP